MFHSNWKEGEGIIYMFAKFQSKFIFSLYLNVNILEGEHVALQKKSYKKMTHRSIKNRAESKLFEKKLSYSDDKEMSSEIIDSKRLSKDSRWCAAHRLNVIMRSNSNVC